MKVYLAGGWFSEEQKEALKVIQTELQFHGIDYFSPKDEILWEPGMPPSKVLNKNLDGMEFADMIIASTEGKDMGTLFECGYAFGRGIPIAYYFPHPDMKFNVMLAATAVAVLTSVEQLSQYCYGLSQKRIKQEDWIGDME